MGSPSLAPGTIVAGDFCIQRALASGGMGAVFVAEQLSTGKLRALKVMHRELLVDDRMRQRFEQEARVAARIESDHVVEVVGAGIDPATGTPWLAMELLEGSDLAAYLERRGTLPPEEVRDLMGQLCHGLAAAHRAGIVHRDLKPENVFVANARQPGLRFKVKVLDFGIAKVVAEARAGTQMTAAVGTPRYMSPEQTDPSAVISPAADVWALGLIVFQLLTGRFYWTQAVAREGASVMHLMREVLFEPLAPASARAAQLGCAERLPPGFDAWFARCVCRDPSGRFADAGRAWAELDPILAQARHAPWPAPAPTVQVPAPPVPPVQARAMTPGSTSPAAAHTFAPHLAHTPAHPRSRAPLVAILALAVLAALGLVVVGAAFVIRPRFFARLLAPSHDVSGSYTIARATTPDGRGSYGGSVLVASAGEALRLQWNLGNGGGYEGVGLVEGDVLGVGWAQAGRYGVAVYRIEGGTLSGRLVSSDSPGGVVTEELAGAPGLSGTYRITRSSDGRRGTMTITPNGPTYTVHWMLGQASLRGVALREGNALVVGWSHGAPVGVVSYAIAGRRLEGRWALLDDARIGAETLVRR